MDRRGGTAGELLMALVLLLELMEPKLLLVVHQLLLLELLLLHGRSCAGVLLGWRGDKRDVAHCLC